MEIAIPHRLMYDEALQRIKGLLGEVKTDFADKISDLNERWTGNTCVFSFRAMGFAVSGTLVVDASEVKLSGILPLAASFFRGKIESIIRERANNLLA